MTFLRNRNFGEETSNKATFLKAGYRVWCATINKNEHMPMWNFIKLLTLKCNFTCKNNIWVLDVQIMSFVLKFCIIDVVYCLVKNNTSWLK